MDNKSFPLHEHGGIVFFLDLMLDVTRKRN